MRSTNVQSYQTVPTGWECSVCLDDKIEGLELRGHSSEIGKDHIYHKECLNEAMQRKPDCPLCRLPLSSREVTIESIDLLDAPKQYMAKVAQHLPQTAAFTASLVTFSLITGSSSIRPAISLVGLLVGGSASCAVRNLSNAAPIEQNLLEPGGLKEMASSHPFIGAVAATALLGSVATVSSILYYSAPILLAGLVVHHAADKAQENELISEEQKQCIQTISAVTTSALSLINPINTLISLGIGASLGAAAEAYYAQSQNESEPEA